MPKPYPFNFLINRIDAWSKKMFKSPATSIFYGGILILLIFAGIYLILDTWLEDYDRCDPLICTEGYPCFEQGDCGPSPEL